MVFFSDQENLMLGLGLQGTKITQIPRTNNSRQDEVDSG
jgi:hypothetical protein